MAFVLAETRNTKSAVVFSCVFLITLASAELIPRGVTAGRAAVVTKIPAERVRTILIFLNKIIPLLLINASFYGLLVISVPNKDLVE